MIIFYLQVIAIIIIICSIWYYRKQKYIYKVVICDGPIFRSALVNGHALVEYKLNKWIEAPPYYAKYGYHLFAFDTLKNAQQFIYGAVRSWGILKCSYRTQDVCPLPIKKMIDYVGNSTDITNAPSAFVSMWPEGTVCVKALIPLRVVSEE